MWSAASSTRTAGSARPSIRSCTAGPQAAAGPRPAAGSRPDPPHRPCARPPGPRPDPGGPGRGRGAAWSGEPGRGGWSGPGAAPPRPSALAPEVIPIRRSWRPPSARLDGTPPWPVIGVTLTVECQFCDDAALALYGPLYPLSAHGIGIRAPQESAHGRAPAAGVLAGDAERPRPA